MKSQTNLILSHLKKGRTITPLQALNLFGCFRLGARCWDLRELGYNIKTTIMKSGKKHFAEYKLIRK
jgi:hypothetical protein